MFKERTTTFVTTLTCVALITIAAFGWARQTSDNARTVAALESIHVILRELSTMTVPPNEKRTFVCWKTSPTSTVVKKTEIVTYRGTDQTSEEHTAAHLEEIADYEAGIVASGGEVVQCS
jgi:hypothetical protein